jgi:Holliday junction resolvase
MRRLAIEMHCTRTHKFFIDQHPGNNCVLFIELFTNRHMSAIKNNNQSVFVFQLLQFDYEI